MPDRRSFLLTTCAFALAGCATTSGVALPPNSTLIVVRHGDRDGEHLNAKGIARANALTGALSDTPLDAIYSPGIQRNLDTAKPIATARGLPIQRLSQENPAPRLVHLGAGRTSLWVGNKGNIAAIWESLALPEPSPLNYGDLHLIQSDAQGRVTIERRRFGPT